MPKYLNTKPGSLESAVLEAVSPAQQAAIAIAKKEKGEKPKNEEKVECPQCEGKGCDHCDGKGYHEEQVSEKANFSPKEIKMAIGVASDPRYKGGNYTGAVKAIEKIAKGLSDHPQVAAVLKRQNEMKEETEYQKFFKATLKKFGVSSPGELDGEKEKEFYNYIDKNWKGEDEKKEEVKEEVSLAQLAAQHITNMWKESAYGAKKKVDNKEEVDDNEDEGDDGKTMTGKPMSKVEVNPKTKEK